MKKFREFLNNGAKATELNEALKIVKAAGYRVLKEDRSYGDRLERRYQNGDPGDADTRALGNRLYGGRFSGNSVSDLEHRRRRGSTSPGTNFSVLKSWFIKARNEAAAKYIETYDGVYRARAYAHSSDERVAIFTVWLAGLNGKRGFSFDAAMALNREQTKFIAEIEDNADDINEYTVGSSEMNDLKSQIDELFDNYSPKLKIVENSFTSSAHLPEDQMAKAERAAANSDLAALIKIYSTSADDTSNTHR